jgi:hypothetical protein
MSTKTTILLTDKEHWYEEMHEPRYVDGKYIGNDIHIEIDNSSMVFPLDAEVIDIVIRADSELAAKLRMLKHLNL